MSRSLCGLRRTPRRRLAGRARRATHNHGAVLAVLKPTPAPGFVIGDVPMPSPAAGQVLLRVLATSVCGTDVHLYDWNPWAAARVHPPRVVGHEVCGEVVAWGDGVHGPALGTRVAVESHIVCGHCDECRRGDFHVCENTRILGVDVDGAFATHLAVPAANVWPVGDAVPPTSPLRWSPSATPSTRARTET